MEGGAGRAGVDVGSSARASSGGIAETKRDVGNDISLLEHLFFRYCENPALQKWPFYCSSSYVQRMDFEPDRFAVNRDSKYEHSQLITRKHHLSHSSSQQLIVFPFSAPVESVMGIRTTFLDWKKRLSFHSAKSRPITLCAADYFVK
jgi:hypothetical protein